MRKTVSACALNIRIHPHNPQRYIALFNSLRNLSKEIEIGNDQCLRMLDKLDEVEVGDPLKGITGKLAKYTELSESDWLNLNKQDTAEKGDLRAISIPEHLLPNYTPFHFVFFPKKHILVVQTISKLSKKSRSLGPTNIEKYLKALCNHPNIVSTYGEVDITVLPEHKQIEKIISNECIRSLTISLERPNSDDMVEIEAEILDELDSQNVSRKKIELSAQRNESIVLSENTKTVSKVAARNGYVEARVPDEEGKLRVISTKDKPLLKRLSYNAKEVSLISALVALGYELLQGLN